MRWIITTLMLLGCAAGLSANQAQPRKFALVVGCTRYDALPKQYHLKGPANDVLLVFDLLVQKFGFDPGQIVTLSEAPAQDELRPTRANIERAFRALAEKAGPGDQIAIWMGGHGTQVPDDNPGAADDTEFDGWDELFLAADAAKMTANEGTIPGGIRDDELRAWLDAIRAKGANVWIVVDACHSGTMTRGSGIETPRWVQPEDLIPSEILENRKKPDEASRGAGGEQERDTDLVSEAGGPGMGTLVAFYAAQSIEPTVERPFPLDAAPAEQTTYGLLSYTINAVLSRVQEPLTYTELMQQVQRQYASWGRSYPTPLLEGDATSFEVLGQQQWPDRSRFFLTESDAGFQLNAGSLHGIGEGSILALYAEIGGEAKPIGHVKVTLVRALDCDVEPCEHNDIPAPTSLAAGTRCEVVVSAYPIRPARLALDENVDEQIRGLNELHELMQQQFATIPLIEFSQDILQADWLLRIKDGQGSLVPAEGWARGEAGEQREFGPVPLDEHLGEWLAERMQRIARATNLLRMAAPLASGDRLGGGSADVTINIIRYENDKDQTGKPVDWTTDGLTLNKGDLIRFEIVNRGREPVDVTLLFIDSGYGIFPLFPRAGTITDNRIMPNQRVLTSKARISDTTIGLEHLLAIAVRGQGPPSDFTWLSQPTIEQARSVGNTRGGSKSALTQLLETAAYATGQTRGMAMEEEENQVFRLISWTVAP